MFSYKHTSLSLETFIFENKSYKTCANCLTKRSNKKAEKQSLPSDNDSESTNIRTESQSENNTDKITFINIIEYISNQNSNLEEDLGISFNLRIKIDDNILANVQHDTKLLVKLIVDEIEEGDRYNWT
ncbi:7430_t:CDS:1 [Cetraspora pellucida]|uniref:7430_t:CDS:1 n=1 Tax=Cetraspora pellucida TaxID=1433469 RepID=A0A9N9CQ54_9GLOM|nr:7430_t:CDS:1 [Cetraspora pellucida]